MQITRRRTESGDIFLAFGNFIEEMIVKTSDTISPVERETQVETQSLDHGHTINWLRTMATSLIEISDEIRGLEVEEGNVGLDAWSIER